MHPAARPVVLATSEEFLIEHFFAHPGASSGAAADAMKGAGAEVPVGGFVDKW